MVGGAGEETDLQGNPSAEVDDRIEVGRGERNQLAAALVLLVRVVVDLDEFGNVDRIVSGIFERLLEGGPESLMLGTFSLVATVDLVESTNNGVLLECILRGG